MHPGPKNIWGNSEHDGSPRDDTIVPTRRAAKGSGGLDLCATSELLLTQDMGVQVIETDVFGPLEKDTVGIVLGHSSSIMKGLIVHPGVIDPAYEGCIKILCHSPYGVVSIAPGDRIAQLLVLPSGRNKLPAEGLVLKDKSLAPMGVDLACLSLELDQRPILNLEIEGKIFSGLVDTGADKSIIRSQAWPKRWPLQQASQSLQGLGYAQTPHISAKELVWRTEDQRETFQPFVVDFAMHPQNKELSHWSVMARWTPLVDAWKFHRSKICSILSRIGGWPSINGNKALLSPLCENA